MIALSAMYVRLAGRGDSHSCQVDMTEVGRSLAMEAVLVEALRSDSGFSVS